MPCANTLGGGDGHRHEDLLEALEAGASSTTTSARMIDASRAAEPAEEAVVAGGRPSPITDRDGQHADHE